MRTIIWNLNAGGMVGQQTFDIKRQEGLNYIERLKQDGENIIKIEEQTDKMIITLE